MKVKFTLVLLCLSVFSFSQTTRTVIGNDNNGWNEPTNWSPTGVPQNGDEVIIPASQSIRVKGPVYGSTAPNLKIVVYGIMAFDNSGKLELGPSATIQLVNSSAKITSDETPSEVIKIAGETKFVGDKDRTLSGPAFSSLATLESPNGFASGVLPVKLEKFIAKFQNKQVLLQWTSASEENSFSFTIERSTDTRNWNPVGTVAAKGFAYQYSFNDAHPAKGTNFYRLRMTDIDGKTESSTIIRVDESNALAAFIHPNPASSQLTITLSSQPETATTVQLLQLDGRVSLERLYSGGEDIFSIPVSNLPRGLYHVVLKNPKELISSGTVILR